MTLLTATPRFAPRVVRPAGSWRGGLAALCRWLAALAYRGIPRDYKS